MVMVMVMVNVMVMVMVKVMVMVMVQRDALSNECKKTYQTHRLVCECILVVWSAIYLGIAIRFWILLSMIASSSMFCLMKIIPSSESVGSWEGRSSRRTWFFVLQESSSSSRASLFWSEEEKSPTRSNPTSVLKII